MAAPTFTLCPPADASGGFRWKQCLSAKMLPISATFHADGEVESTGISFSDYNFMQTSVHKLSGERRLECPDWVLNDVALRRVLVEYLLNRAGIQKKKRDQLHFLSERDSAILAMKLMRGAEERLIERLAKLQDEYAAHIKCESPFCIVRRKRLRQVISSLDSQICLQREPHRFWKVIFCYYRLKLDSVGTAEECHLIPCTVRQILRRMNRCAVSLGYAAPEVRYYHQKKAKRVLAENMCNHCFIREHAEKRKLCVFCRDQVRDAARKRKGKIQ
jgi:hypothetical protein